MQSSQSMHDKGSADSIEINEISWSGTRFVLIDKIFTEFTIKASNKRHQTSKITKFQPKLEL